MDEPKQWFVDMGTGMSGPFTVEQVTTMIRNGMVNHQTPLSTGPNEPTLPLGNVSEFSHTFPNRTEVVKNTSRRPIIVAVAIATGAISLTLYAVASSSSARSSECDRGLAAADLSLQIGNVAQAQERRDGVSNTCPTEKLASFDERLSVKKDELLKEAEAKEQAKEPTFVERLASTTRLTGAIAILKPLFKDTVNEQDEASAALSAWSHNRMTWSELSTIEETSRAKVMKDADAERGKRLCNTGTIVEIATDRSAGFPLYLGGLMTPAFGVVRFIAVKSTGNLVEQSTARFCGIVTGRQSYTNASGGTTHAVMAVGMFDLPENRRALAGQ